MIKFIIPFLVFFMFSHADEKDEQDYPMQLISPDYGVLKEKDLHYFDWNFSWICFKDVKVKTWCDGKGRDDGNAIMTVRIQDRYAIHEMGISRRAMYKPYCEVMRKKFLDTIADNAPFCMLAWDFSKEEDRKKGKYNWGFEKFKSKRGMLGYWEMGEYIESLMKKGLVPRYPKIVVPKD